ncbi:zinc-ribbon domain-containing protein [Aliiroseovarius sediminis]|uniref:zinc-ribbon domain-containing protein n=1 Tax=Aliiroseovarius sediminis TaxID=2925839 RepID=UPI001F5A10C8|nr:zinc-ribbon domain-containing protein [Aliiroseovarius sediminis]MCI2395549.1 zinc-ribbon domain-containing protein [Aliiroseovarius sediminis]
MRLVCPNCGAQYEVDDRVMPETGRDVQCSNCGHAWFQVPPSVESKEVEPQEEDVATPSPFDDIEDIDEDDAGEKDTETSVSPDALDEEASVDESVDDDDDDNDGADAPAAMPARQLDDNVRSILHEEAERERSAREEDREALETQTDLGLDEAPGPTEDEAARDTATGQSGDGSDNGDDQPLAPDEMKGRNVLPDIEEINSTLDAPDGQAAVATPEPDTDATPGTTGFRRGFILVIVIACLLAILYIFAPVIAERVPALEPFLEQFVDLADRVRIGVEETMSAAVEKMQGLLDQPDNG